MEIWIDLWENTNKFKDDDIIGISEFELIKVSEPEKTLIYLIEYPNEERNLEFKQSMLWDKGRNSVQITKSVLALSNLRDGGWIVIGKEEQVDGTFVMSGMKSDDYDSFNFDDAKDFVNKYADPYATFTLRKKEHKGKKFVLIRVEEFEEVPVICKRSHSDIIHKGKIYVRSKGKPESIPIPSQSEMRELIELATDKRMEKRVTQFVQQLEHLGVKITPSESDEEAFDKQVEDLK